MIESTRVEDSNRRALESLGYRMLGSWADAEDVAQDTLLKWHTLSEESRDLIKEPLAWLRKVATRLCLDLLKSSRRQRESYVGPWLPEPILVDDELPAESLEREESVNMALMMALEKLSAAERAAFLLHDVFDYSFDSVADILERPSANCRKLASRARVTIRNERSRFDFDPDKHQQLLNAFSKAASEGDSQALESILAEDVLLYSDGGGVAPAARKILETREIVMRLFLGLGKKARDRDVQTSFRFHKINGMPGLLQLREGFLETALSLAVSENRITEIYQQRNPHKLAKIATQLNLKCAQY